MTPHQRLRGVAVRALGVGLLLSLGLLALGLLPPTPSGAEERVERSVGVAPIRGDGNPAELAMLEAVSAALLRTAKGLLPDDFTPPDSERGDDGRRLSPDDWLAAKLGENPYIYATRFSILEDRGRRPAIFASDPEVQEEYVLVAQVGIDETAVAERLAALGVLGAAGSGGGDELILVLEGLTSWRSLEAVRKALERDRSVRKVVPIEFSSGRAVLAISADRGISSLVSALEERVPSGLSVVVADLRSDQATLIVGGRP